MGGVYVGLAVDAGTNDLSSRGDAEENGENFFLRAHRASA